MRCSSARTAMLVPTGGSCMDIRLNRGGVCPRIGGIQRGFSSWWHLAPLAAWIALPPPAAAEPPAANVVTTVAGIETIRMEPRWDAPAIGTIRAGQSVRVAKPAVVDGPAAATCKGGWVAIEPRGYVCI